MPDSVLVRSITADEFSAWRRLYADYGSFYKTAMSDETFAAVWQWLQSGGLRGYAAFVEGDPAMAGIAHVSAQLRPLRGGQIAYLHDLFVCPQRRGRGVGRRLLAHCAADASARGQTMMRWATAEGNATARRLYDKLAQKTDWLIYDMQLQK